SQTSWQSFPERDRTTGWRVNTGRGGSPDSPAGERMAAHRPGPSRAPAGATPPCVGWRPAHPCRPYCLHSPAKTTDCNKASGGSQVSGLKNGGKSTANPPPRVNLSPDVFVIPYLFMGSGDTRLYP